MRLVEITFGPEQNFITFKVAWVPGSTSWFYRLSRWNKLVRGAQGWFWFLRAWRLDFSVKRGYK